MNVTQIQAALASTEEQIKTEMFPLVGAVISIVPDSVVSPEVGQNLTVDVAITRGQGITGFEFELNYDSQSHPKANLEKILRKRN